MIKHYLRHVTRCGKKWASKSNITLIGDAAHLMPPSGEGVNTAMLDALDLSECLTNGAFNDLKAAIAAYEEKMLARAKILGEEALEAIRDFSSPSDAAMKALEQQLSQAAEDK